jgi:hypothetical protein
MGNSLGNAFGNLGTYWEHDGNKLEIFSNEFVAENVNFFVIMQNFAPKLHGWECPGMLGNS